MTDDPNTSTTQESDAGYGEDFLDWNDETYDWRGLDVRPAKTKTWKNVEGEEQRIGNMVVSRVVDGDIDAFIDEFAEYEMEIPERFEFGVGEFLDWEKAIDPKLNVYWSADDPTVDVESEYGADVPRFEAAMRVVAESDEYDPDEYEWYMCGPAGFLFRGPNRAMIVSPSFTD